MQLTNLLPVMTGGGGHMTPALLELGVKRLKGRAVFYGGILAATVQVQVAVVGVSEQPVPPHVVFADVGDV